MPLWIGTSGWQYRHWLGDFYPRGLPTDRWFERYVDAFPTVELNVTFYRQPAATVFEGWARRAPEGFLFAVKASRFLTHVRRLREPRESVERLLEGASRLGPHLGPILLQLPPDMAVEPERLAETLDAFPRGMRLTFEPRHRSWFSDEVRLLLRERGAALCWADRRGALNPTTTDWATAAWGYVRFHAGRSLPPGCYGEAALRRWAELVATTWGPDRDVFAYFNNDRFGCALRNAGVFHRAAGAAGLRAVGTPVSPGPV